MGYRCEKCNGLEKQRYLFYNSHLGRFAGSLEDYKWDNPVHWAAAGTHVMTQGFGLDPAIRDVARSIDGDTTPIEPYGQFGRIREDVLGSLQRLFKGKPVSAVAGLINIPGDAIADGVDFVVDVNHKRGAFHNNIEHVIVSNN